MRASARLFRATSDLPTPVSVSCVSWSRSLTHSRQAFDPPFRIRNMLKKNPTGFSEFGPRYWTGTVLHTKMSQTASVLVKRRDPHPLYKKPVLSSSKYLVHDPENKCRAGDRILFEKSRPFSKRKHWLYRVTLARDSASTYLQDNPDVAASIDKSERRVRSEQMADSGRV